jgi:hypothetical protein
MLQFGQSLEALVHPAANAQPHAHHYGTRQTPYTGSGTNYINGQPLLPYHQQILSGRTYHPANQIITGNGHHINAHGNTSGSETFVPFANGRGFHGPDRGFEPNLLNPAHRRLYMNPSAAELNWLSSQGQRTGYPTTDFALYAADATTIDIHQQLNQINMATSMGMA